MPSSRWKGRVVMTALAITAGASLTASALEMRESFNVSKKTPIQTPDQILIQTRPAIVPPSRPEITGLAR